MSKHTFPARWLVVALGAGALACDAPATAPADTPAPSFAVLGADGPAAGNGPFAAAYLQAGSSCSLGKGDKMEARVYWNTGDGSKVKSFLLWLDGAQGERQLTRKVLGAPKDNGVAAGFEFQKHGPWTQARLELYEGSPDYTAARTTLTIACD